MSEMSYNHDAHEMECPRCGRRTIYCSKAEGALRINPDKGKYVTAVNRTGICYTCHRAAKGLPPKKTTKPATPERRRELRHTAAGGTLKRDRRSSGVTNKDLGINPYLRGRVGISDTEVEYLRRAIKGMIADRRARNVPPWGVATEDYAYGNGGLYASEVK